MNIYLSNLSPIFTFFIILSHFLLYNEISKIPRAYSILHSGVGFFVSLFVCFCFLELHLQHMEVPRLGIKLELQLPAYTTATATWNPSHVCKLRHSSQQHQILNLLSEARDQTHILLEISQVHFP